MSRSRRRTSRKLIAVLATVLVVAAVFFWHDGRKKRPAMASSAKPAANTSVATNTPAPAASTPMARLLPAGPTLLPPVVTSTPTGPQAAKSSAPIVTPPPAAVPAQLFGLTDFAAATPTSQPSVVAVPPAPPTMPPAALASSVVTPPVLAITPAMPAGPLSTLASAKAKFDGGDLLGARAAYNPLLLSGTLSPADVAMAKKQMAAISAVVTFSPKRFPDDPFQSLYSVKPGDTMRPIAASHAVTSDLLCNVNRMADARKLRAGQTLKVINGPFHVVVSKSTFTMDVYLGAPGGPNSLYVMSYLVGLGTDNGTPTGTWSITSKLRHPDYFSPRGEGVIHAGDPRNPLGDYWMGLTGTDGQAVGKLSYGIHGTIDQDSIGKQSSMGCIRLRNDDVAVLYTMLGEGKTMVIVNP